MAMSILEQNDVLTVIVSHMDIISLIFLLMTNKKLFSQRKLLVQFSKYFNKDKISEDKLMLYMYYILNAYIDTSCFYRKADSLPVIWNYNKNPICLKMLENTRQVISIGSLIKPDYALSVRYLNHLRELASVYSRFICNKYGYITNKCKIYYPLIHIFDTGLWLNCDIDVMHFFTLAYHVKFKKNKNILDTLQHLHFNGTSNAYDTIEYLLSYNRNLSNNQYKMLVIFIICKYIYTLPNSTEYIDYYIRIANTMTRYLNFAIPSSKFPKYLKTYLIANLKISNGIYWYIS